MKERPIIFSAPMVRAILAGTKTQTRRVLAGYSEDLSRVTQWARWPYGAPGDRLWVRETHVTGTAHGGAPWVRYRATDEGDVPEGTRWRPSIHMPRWASRITLKIVSVRVERLQEITEEDARAEGLATITKDDGRTWKYGIPDRDGLPGTDDYGWPWNQWSTDPREAFARAWDQINGKRSPWALNPWVGVITFRDISRGSSRGSGTGT